MCAAQACIPKACNSFLKKRTRPGFFCCIVALGIVATATFTAITELRSTTYFDAASSRTGDSPACCYMLNDAEAAALSGSLPLQLQPGSTRVDSPAVCKALTPSAQLFSPVTPMCLTDNKARNSAAVSLATPVADAFPGQHLPHMPITNTCSPVSLLQTILVDTMCSADISIL